MQCRYMFSLPPDFCHRRIWREGGGIISSGILYNIGHNKYPEQEGGEKVHKHKMVFISDVAVLKENFIVCYILFYIIFQKKFFVTIFWKLV